MIMKPKRFAPGLDVRRATLCPDFEKRILGKLVRMNSATPEEAGT